MKKIYTIAIAFFATWGVTAQTASPFPGTTLKHRVGELATSLPVESLQRTGPSTPVILAVGDTIYYDDFSTPSNWTINGAAPNGWEFTTSNVGWANFAINPINSTSGGQYIILEDGDPTAGSNQGGPYYITMSNPINFSTFNSVMMQFEIAGAKFFDDLLLEYSYDNATWIELMNVTQGFSDLTASGGAATANPEYIQLNVTAAAAGQAQVYFRYAWSGANGTYAWMIDDLLFTEGSSYDIAISDTSYLYLHNWLLPYYSMIPKTHADTIFYAATTVNVGVATSTNTVLDVSVNDGSGVVFSSSSLPVDITAGTDSFLVAENFFVPTMGGSYTATYTVSADSADGNLNDNSFSSETYTVTDSVYARDFEAVSLAMTASTYSETGGYAFGNLFDFVQDDKIKSISVFIETTTPVGTPMIGVVYGNDMATIIAATDIYATQAGDANGWVTLPIFETGGMLGTGTPATEVDVLGLDFYLVAIDNLGGSQDNLKIGGHSGKGGFNGHYGNLGGSWFWLNETPMVRVNTVGNPCNYYLLNETIVDAACNGTSDGSISLVPTGGANYTYVWNTGASTSAIANLPAGSYDVTVTDANCLITGNFSVGEPDMLTATVNSNDATCGLDNGNATVSTTGGTMPYNYIWDNTMNTSFISNLAAATYDVTVTDANGCTAVNSGTVNTTNSTITLNTTIVANDSCGYYLGEITANAISTGGAVSYLWNNGDATATTVGLSIGIYTVTATDAAGCSTSTSANITATVPALVATVTTTDATCGASDGTATIVVGSATPYSYAWASGATTATVTGLEALTMYIVTVTDGNGCVESGDVFVVNPAASISITTASTTVDCYGSSTATATATAVSAGSMFSYWWYGENGAPLDSTFAVTTSNTISGLAAGYYTVGVVDNNMCSTFENITITEPTMLIATASVTADVTCNGNADGATMVTVSGGTIATAYSYAWDGGLTNASVTGLAAGTINVTVTDDNACTVVTSATVGTPSAIAIAINAANISCNGMSDGTINVMASGGGVGGYSYAWDNGLSAVNIQNGLGANTYNITVTDANNCVATSSSTIIEPTILGVTITATNDFVCFNQQDGVVSATVTGGTGVPTYYWSAGNSNAATNNSLPAGTYDLIIVDANGCAATSNTVTITEGSSALQVVGSAVDETCLGCNDGQASVVASGGDAPYTYSWNVSGTSSTITNLNPTPGGSTIYQAIVTDVNGCSKTVSIEVKAGPDGIENTENLTLINVYPNPNNGTFNIALNSNTTTQYSFIVRNVIGQTVLMDSETISGNYVKTIDLNNATNGVYFLTVKSTVSEKTVKIIVK